MKKTNEEEVGETWFSDEDSDECGTYIIARLFYTEENGASIAVHHGTKPILNAPLLMTAMPPNGRELSIHFRDFALMEGRVPGSQCIRRLFKLTFAQPFEAVAFQCCHNIFLRGMFASRLGDDDGEAHAEGEHEIDGGDDDAYRCAEAFAARDKHTNLR